MPTVEMPKFVGQYFIEFTDGSCRLLTLVGALQDTMGHIIFLYDDEDKVYNYDNIISTKEKKRN